MLLNYEKVNIDEEVVNTTGSEVVGSDSITLYSIHIIDKTS
jgi:hypothetical protein